MSEAGFELAWRPGGHVLQALARVTGADLAEPLAAIAEAEPFAVRRAGPDSWFLVGAATLGAAEIAQRSARVAGAAWLVDQSHGRRRLILTGPRSERRLARGVGLDFARFGIGASCETQYAHIGLHLTRTAAQTFDILVARSFAEALWQELSA